MHNKSLTVAIYGIQDTGDHDYPDYVHDHNITLFEGGRIRRHLALERHTRNKYDKAMPEHLYGLLKEEGLLGRSDLELVFVDNPIGRAFINQQGNIRFEAPLREGLLARPEKGRLYFPGAEPPAYVVNHELAHVFSNLPFHGPFKDNSLHVHFDGGASQSNFSAWMYKNGSLSLIEKNWDLQYLSALFNANALNFAIIGAGKKDQNGMPGKFMGYSAYGQYDKKIEAWLRRHRFFNDIWASRKPFFERLKKDWRIEMNHFNLQHPFIQDIAATVQAIFQRDWYDKIKDLKRHTGAEYLYYSGGSALNIKANTVLADGGLFREVYVPPATNDSGLSIGAGAFMQWQRNREVARHGPYLNNWGLDGQPVVYNQADLEETARRISQGQVVALCNGPGEAGPRALGNRSLLARADNPELAQHVSMEMKARAWYRPLAPVMLAKNLPKLIPGAKADALSRYMLREFKVPYSLSQPFSGVVHVDGSLRIQTLEQRQDNPYLYDLLEMLEKKYELMALLNTSFNAPGRPIVHTTHDALQEARQMGVKCLVVNGQLQSL